MKCLGLALLLIGFASAAYYDVLEGVSNDAVTDFMMGMENAPSLQDVLGEGYSEEVEQIENDIKTELGKTLKESLDAILEKIKVATEHGKKVGQELLERAKDIVSKLKELGQDAGSKAKELLERVKEKAAEWLRKLLEKLGLGKRSLEDFFTEMLLEIQLRSLLNRLKTKLLDKFDVDAVAEYLEKVFGKFDKIGQALLESLKNKGPDALRELLEGIIPSQEYALEEVDEDKPVDFAYLAIAKIACKVIKMMTTGVSKAVIKTFLNRYAEPKWRDRIIKAMDISFPIAQRILRPFCFAAAPAGQYGLQDLWERVKDVFKDLGSKIQEKFYLFAEWLRGVVREGVEKAKDKISELRRIAQDVITNARTLSKEAAEEALKFFEPYKKDLGQLWDQLKESVSRVVKGN